MGSIFFVYFLRKQQKNEVRNSLSGINILLIINRSVGPCTKTSTLGSSCVRTKRLLLEVIPLSGEMSHSDKRVPVFGEKSCHEVTDEV